MHSRALLVLLLLAMAGGFAAGENGSEPDPIPAIDLDRLDPQVRAQLAKARQTLDELLVSSPPTALTETAVEALVATGRLYLAYDYLEAGLACLERAREASTLDPDSLYLIGYALERGGRRLEAIDAYEKLLELGSATSIIRLRLANQLLEIGLLEDAARHYEQTFGADRSCVGALYGLGEIARRQHDHERAAAYFERALEIDPQATQLRYSLGLALRRLGRVDEAKALLESADWKQLNFGGWLGCADPVVGGLMELTTGAPAHILRAGQASFKGLPAVELAEYGKAIEANPDDAVAWANYGAAIYRQGNDLGKAASAFRRATEIDRANPIYHSDLGQILVETGSTAEGIEYLRTAVALDPRFIDANLALADLALKESRFEEVVEHNRRVLEVDPLRREPRLQLAMALFRLGRQSESVVELGSLMDLHPPEDPRERLQLATMLASLGDRRRAMEHLVAIRDTTADSAIGALTWMRIGQIQMQQGELDQAIASLGAALDLQPELDEARASLARARQLQQSASQ